MTNESGIRIGGSAYFKDSQGIFLGALNSEIGLFFCDYELPYGLSFKDIWDKKNKLSDIAFILVRDYFGYHSLTQELVQRLNQKRFCFSPLNELSKIRYTPVSESSLQELMSKRHKYIGLVHRYIKNDKDAAIERVCERIIQIQSEIESRFSNV